MIDNFLIAHCLSRPLDIRIANTLFAVTLYQSIKVTNLVRFFKATLLLYLLATCLCMILMNA
jgi:hypothetical protein